MGSNGTKYVTIVSGILPSPSENRVYKTGKLLISIVLVMIFLRLFLYQHFLIPSPSMTPTLLVGEMVIVNKSTYGYSKYNMPFHIDFFNGKRVWEKMPKRGDIVVFNCPQNPKIDFVKRCIGLPGDRIKFEKGVLYINGQPCTYKSLRQFEYFDTDEKQKKLVNQYEETFPDSRYSHTIIRVNDTQSDLNYHPDHNTYEIVIPEDHFLPIGDNRNRSWDGRKFGPVHKQRLIGSVKYILMSFKFEFRGEAKKPLTWYKISIWPKFSRFGLKPL